MRCSDPLDYESMTIDMGRRRVTDMPQNSCVILPKPAGVSKELKLLVRKNKYLNTFINYVASKCGDKGD